MTVVRRLLAVGAVLALAIAAGLLTPVARATHNPAAPFAGNLSVVTDLDPRPATFTLGVTTELLAGVAFREIGATPGAVPYAGCDVEAFTQPPPVFYVGTYTTAAGDSGRVAGCQEAGSSVFFGWYRSSAQTSPDFAWGITLTVGGPTGGPGAYALPGELLPERRLTWQEALTQPPPPSPSPPAGPVLGPPPGACDATSAFELRPEPQAGAHTGPRRATEEKPKTFCGFKPLRDDVRAGVEGNAATAGGVAFTTCLAALGGGVLAGLSVPASAGATAPALPPVVQGLLAACGTSLVAWWGTSVRGEWDDIVRTQTGAPRFEHALGPHAGPTALDGRRIVLPRPRLARGTGLDKRCTSGPGRGRCLRMAAVAGRAVSASGEAASLAEAMAVSTRLGARAALAGDAEGATIQEAVADLYAGALADAVIARQRAFAAFARRLRAEGLDLRLSRARVARARGRLSRLKGVPPAVIARLRSDGFSAAQIRATFVGLAELPAPPLTLTGVLRARAPTAGLAAAPDSITSEQVGAIVRALAAQGALPTGLAATLLADLERLRVAGAADRTAAADRLAADARRAKGRYGLVLQLAVRPLVSLEGG